MDYAATSPLAPGVLDAMLPFLTGKFGNPSSKYGAGYEAKQAVENARVLTARALNAAPDEIYFTGSGTESINWAITGALSLFHKKRAGRIPRIITALTEHHAVLHTAHAAESSGVDIGIIPVDADGCAAAEDLRGLLTPATALVTVMAANNEVGTLQPVGAIGDTLRGTGILFHTDAVQAAGHIPVDVARWGVDLLSLAAHKFGGPKGVGALYIKRDIPLPPMMQGGAHERGRRPGTENVPGIVGLGAALDRAVKHLDAESKRLTGLRDKLIAGVLGSVPRTRLTGHPAARLPGSASFVIEGINSAALIEHLDLLHGICVSSGSACTAGDAEPSHVLTAMGVPYAFVHGSLRCTLGHGSTEADVEALLKALPGAVAGLRKASSMWVE